VSHSFSILFEGFGWPCETQACELPVITMMAVAFNADPDALICVGISVERWWRFDEGLII
jgi:hypothetical protein